MINRGWGALHRAYADTLGLPLGAAGRGQTASERIAATFDGGQARDEPRRDRIDPLTGALGRALEGLRLSGELTAHDTETASSCSRSSTSTVISRSTTTKDM